MTPRGWAAKPSALADSAPPRPLGREAGRRSPAPASPRPPNLSLLRPRMGRRLGREIGLRMQTRRRRARRAAKPGGACLPRPHRTLLPSPAVVALTTPNLSLLRPRLGRRLGHEIGLRLQNRRRRASRAAKPGGACLPRPHRTLMPSLAAVTPGKHFPVLNTGADQNFAETPHWPCGSSGVAVLVDIAPIPHFTQEMASMSAVASAFVSKHSVMFTLTAARNADSKLAKGPPRGTVERFTVSPGSTTNSLTPVVTKTPDQLRAGNS